MTSPLVSVVIPTHNRERFLREAVASVAAQTYDNWELVVVDDGSTDGTRAFLEGLADARVRPVWLARQGNAAALRNIGVQHAKGSHVAFLDSDDLWLPEKLVEQVKDLAANPECRWSYVGRICVDERGAELTRPDIRPFVPYRGWILEEVLESQALIATSAVLVQRSFFESLGAFNPVLLRCQDSDLWIRLAEASPVAVVERTLVHKRIHPADRKTSQLNVQSYMNLIYDGVLARNRSPKIRRLCRSARARVNIAIASRLSGAGQHAEAREALRAAFPHAGWHPRWWAAWLRTALR